jgi:hypothetical protein
MYENETMRPVETLPGMGGEGIKQNDGGKEFNYDILSELCNLSTIIFKREEKNTKKSKPKSIC